MTGAPPSGAGWRAPRRGGEQAEVADAEVTPTRCGGGRRAARGPTPSSPVSPTATAGAAVPTWSARGPRRAGVRASANLSHDGRLRGRCLHGQRRAEGVADEAGDRGGRSRARRSATPQRGPETRASRAPRPPAGRRHDGGPRVDGRQQHQRDAGRDRGTRDVQPHVDQAGQVRASSRNRLTASPDETATARPPVPGRPTSDRRRFTRGSVCQKTQQPCHCTTAARAAAPTARAPGRPGPPTTPRRRCPRRQRGRDDLPQDEPGHRHGEAVEDDPQHPQR